MEHEFKLTVVIAEDEPLIARHLRRCIEKADDNLAVVGVAANGEQALEMIEENLPNFVVTDIRMPVMDGLELTRNISERYGFIRCIIVSGYDDFLLAQQAIRYNVQDYLLKPIDQKELEQTLKRLKTDVLASQRNLDAGQPTMKPQETVTLIKEYINKHYAEPLDLTAIADSFGFSPSYLAKIFVRYTGMSPSKYIREYRMKIARQLLRNPDLSVAAVCEMVGYTDPFHFSRTFKKVSGLSPSEFRSRPPEENEQETTE